MCMSPCSILQLYSCRMEILCILKAKSDRASSCFAQSAASLCAPTSNSPWCVRTTSTRIYPQRLHVTACSCPKKLCLFSHCSGTTDSFADSCTVYSSNIHCEVIGESHEPAPHERLPESKLWQKYEFVDLAVWHQVWKVWHPEVDSWATRACILSRKTCRGSQHGLGIFTERLACTTSSNDERCSFWRSSRATVGGALPAKSNAGMYFPLCLLSSWDPCTLGYWPLEKRHEQGSTQLFFSLLPVATLNANKPQAVLALLLTFLRFIQFLCRESLQYRQSSLIVKWLRVNCLNSRFAETHTDQNDEPDLWSWK